MNGKSLYKLAVTIANYSVKLALLEKMAANFGDSIISDDGNSNNSLSLLSAAVVHQQDAPGSNIIAEGGGEEEVWEVTMSTKLYFQRPYARRLPQRWTKT